MIKRHRSRSPRYCSLEPLPYQRGDRPGDRRQRCKWGRWRVRAESEVANIHISLTGAEEHERQDSRPQSSSEGNKEGLNRPHNSCMSAFLPFISPSSFPPSFLPSFLQWSRSGGIVFSETSVKRYWVFCVSRTMLDPGDQEVNKPDLVPPTQSSHSSREDKSGRLITQ